MPRWTEDAWDDYLYRRARDKRTLKRVNALIRDAMCFPFVGLGESEPFKWASDIAEDFGFDLSSVTRAFYRLLCRRFANVPQKAIRGFMRLDEMSNSLGI